MCLPSGGGSVGDGGAAAAEAARKARIAETVNKINNVFSDPDRDSIFTGIKEDAQNRFEPDLQRDFEDSQRETKFALSRRGLLGGSQQVESESENDRRFDEGALNIATLSDNAVQDAKSQDERNRLNLINRANAGENQGSIVTDALNSINVSSDLAKTNLANEQLGNFFQGAGNLFTDANTVIGQNQAKNKIGSIFQQSGPLFFSGGDSGTVTSVK